MKECRPNSVCVCARGGGEGGGGLRRRKSRDEVVPLRRSHSSTSVSLTVQLPLHEEVALLFEVDVTVGAHKATGVTKFVSCFHHGPAAGQKTEGDESKE